MVSGQEIVELIKLDAQGRRRATLAVGDHMDALAVGRPDLGGDVVAQIVG